MSAGGTLSLAQHPGDLAHYGAQADVYGAEHPRDAQSLSSVNRTSFERGGGAFTTRNVTGGHVVGLSAQTRQSVVNWDAGSSAPGFQQN
jgi:hypothetical protein